MARCRREVAPAGGSREPGARSRLAVPSRSAGFARRASGPRGADLGARPALVRRSGRPRRSCRRRWRLAACAADAVALPPNWPEWLAIAFGVWRCGGARPAEHALPAARDRPCARARRVSLLIAARGFLRHDYAASLAELGIVPDAATCRPRGFRVARRRAARSTAPLDLAPLLGDPSTGPGPGSRRCRDHRLHLGSTAAPRASCTRAALCLAAERRHGPRHRARRPHLGISAVLLRGGWSGGGGEPHQVERRRRSIRAAAGARRRRFGPRLRPRDRRIVRPQGRAKQAARAPALRGDAALSLQGCRSEHEVGRRALRCESSCRRLVRHDGDPATLHGVAVGRAAGAPHGRPRNTGGSARAAHRGPRRRAVLDRGADGEICVRGPELLVGYWGEPRGACLDRDEVPSAPGDLGRIDDDGGLHFVGRLKDVIRTAGAPTSRQRRWRPCCSEHPTVAAAHAVRIPTPSRRERRRVRGAEGSRGRGDAARALPGPAGELQGAAPALGAQRRHAADQGQRKVEAARPERRRCASQAGDGRGAGSSWSAGVSGT